MVIEAVGTPGMALMAAGARPPDRGEIFFAGWGGSIGGLTSRRCWRDLIGPRVARGEGSLCERAGERASCVLAGVLVAS